MAIEFIVKPKDDLYLEGTLRTLPRVSKGEFIAIQGAVSEHIPSMNINYFVSYLYDIGEAYPCQMQKNQTFSCLFRHYAKHKGLKKEGISRAK